MVLTWIKKMIDKDFPFKVHSKLFFEQPDDVKRNCLQNPPVTGYVGWVEPGQELHSKLESDTEIVQELRECYDYPVHGDGFEVTTFQNSLRVLMQECHPVLNHLFRLLAESLDLNDEDFFVNTVRCLNDPNVSSFTSLRSTYYPPIPENVSEGPTRCEEHADYGLVTLLFQDDEGGLEVKTVDGNWIPVQPIKDSIVVNTGELLEYWTGGYFPATRHRVVVPLDETKKNCCRQSLVYFIPMTMCLWFQFDLMHPAYYSLRSIQESTPLCDLKPLTDSAQQPPKTGSVPIGNYGPSVTLDKTGFLL